MLILTIAYTVLLALAITGIVLSVQAMMILYEELYEELSDFLVYAFLFAVVVLLLTAFDPLHLSPT